MDFPKWIPADEIDSYIKEWTLAGLYIERYTEQGEPGIEEYLEYRVMESIGDRWKVEPGLAGYVQRHDGWWYNLDLDVTMDRVVLEANKEPPP